MSRRWYVVQTKAGKELLATRELRKQRFNVFFPTFQRIIRGKVSTVPLFPSYIFVQFDVLRNKKWRSISNTRGVSRLMGLNEEKATPVPEGCVEEILAKRERNGHILIEKAIETAMNFSPNMELEICAGTFSGHVATYCNHSEKRVFLLLTLLRRKVRISLPVDAVKPHTPLTEGSGSYQNPQ